MTKAEMQLITW